MTEISTTSSTIVYLCYAGNETGAYDYPRQTITVTGMLAQSENVITLQFEIDYPGLAQRLPVRYVLTSYGLDLDYFITDERVIEVAENDYLVKGCYVHFKAGGGFDNWEFAARLKTKLQKEHLRYISCPGLKP